MNTPIPNVREAAEPVQDSREAGSPSGAKICIIGASGKLGRYLVQQALDRGYEVVAVCREVSVVKLEEFSGRITIIPGATDDRQVIERAVAGCDAVLTVLVPRGVHRYFIRNGPGGARPGPSGGSAGVLVWVPHHAGWAGCVLVEGQGDGQRGGPDRAALRPCRPRRPGGGVFSGSSPATRGGPSCAAATWRRASPRACPCGAAMWATRSSRATSRVGWTSPASWWRPLRTTIWFMSHRRSSAARRHRHSPTPPTDRPHLR